MVICVINMKGGVGKSTLTSNIAAGIKRFQNKKVLCIDLDAQSNLSLMSGADLFGYYNIFDVLTDNKHELTMEDCIQETASYDIAVASKQLYKADSLFANTHYDLLANRINEVKDKYDYIFIDTPPSLSAMPTMALYASDAVIIPSEASASAIQGMAQLYEKINEVKNENTKLFIAGIALTSCDERPIFTRQLIKSLNKIAEDQMHTKLFDNRIRPSITVKEAQAVKQSLYEYAPKAKVTKDYENLTREIYKILEGNR